MKKAIFLFVIILFVLFIIWLYNRYAHNFIDDEIAGKILIYASLTTVVVGVLANLKGAIDLIDGIKSPWSGRKGPSYNIPQQPYQEFVGRVDEIKKINELLSPRSRHFVISIDGIGGVGKTSLAIKVAYNFKDRYSKLRKRERFDCIVWVTAKRKYLSADGIGVLSDPTLTLEDILKSIFSVLNESNDNSDHIDKDRVRKILTKQRTLLIIDNFETIDDEGILTFLKEIPSPTKVLITTRHRIDVSYPIRLLQLTEADADELLRQELKGADIELTEEQISKLIYRTGGIPMAMIWIVSLLKSNYTVESILDKLGEPTNDVVKYIFELSIEEIKGSSAHSILLLLAFCDIEIRRDLIGKLTGISTQDRDEGLAKLEQLSLINKVEDRFFMHPLTISYCLVEVKTNSALIKKFAKNFYTNIVTRRLRYQNPDVGFFRSTTGFKSAYIPPQLTTVPISKLGTEASQGKAHFSKMEIQEVLDNSRVFIKSSAGSGKTALLTYLSHEVTKQGWVPVFISLRGYRVGTEGSQGLKELLFEYDFWERQLIMKFMEWGKVALFLDGLDEVSMGHQVNVIATINDIAQAYYSSKIFVTSRPSVGDSISPSFLRLEISPWDEATVTQHVKKYFNNNHEAQKFLSELKGNNYIKDLSFNVLFLNLILHAYSNRGVLPHTKSKLINEFVNALLGSWDQSRQILSRRMELSRQHVLRLLSDLAYGNKILQVRNFGHNEFAEIFGREYSSKTRMNASEVLELLLANGVFVEITPGRYAFVHVIIEEYLCARYFLTSSMDIEEHLFDEDWERVVYFYLCESPGAHKTVNKMLRESMSAARKYPELKKASKFFDNITFYECLRRINFLLINEPETRDLRRVRHCTNILLELNSEGVFFGTQEQQQTLIEAFKT